MAQENRSDRSGRDAEKGEEEHYNIAQSDEYILTDTEKRFLLAAERGDCATVRRMIEDHRDNPKEFSINCVDPLNRSALISAIENENHDLITLLLEEGIDVGDALLHAISEEYVEAVEELLRWEEEHHMEGQPYSWEAVDRSKSNFTPDITPLILAAHRNNYEILKVLLDRGASLPMPHDVKCGCDDCVTSQESDSLRHSQARINAYRALSASSLIALSSRDPLLTAFELSWELKRLQKMETEFRAEYMEMRQNVQEFSTSLLDHARTSTELEVMLNYNHEISSDIWVPGDRQTLERLKLAIKYKQKMFVAHPNVQQLLAAIWYEGLPGFRRKTMPQQLIEVGKLACMFPVYSINYIMAPNSDMGKFMKKPFVKFISHSASYAFFLMLLGAASQRIEHLALKLIGLPWMLELLDSWKKYERGSLPSPIEACIVLYIISLIFDELKTLYSEGLLDYICDLWNIVDFISNMFYVTWILCRTTAWIIVHRDLWYRGLDPWFPRENWHMIDPMLLSEGAFAAGMIFSFLKLVHIFSINPHLGPLQVSLGRMIIDIIKFFFIYTLVLFAFGCGFNQLLWYYADLEKMKCYHLNPEIPDFDEQEKACTIWRRFANLFETSQSLFWASFGLVDLVSFDLQGIKSFTRFWALLMFGSYSVINIIVLLNMLIAMMSNSYQIISERADIEWKFARSQLWMSYFEDGGTVPPPFNLCPTMKVIQKLGKGTKRTRSIIRKSMEKAQILHEKVMRLLVRRFVTAEQRKRDDFGITEDDIIEVRQDISSLRFELLDIFNQNRMKVPDIDKKQMAGTKKGKVMERRIMKDFQIGIVETLATEMSKDATKDVFTSIAKVIGNRQSIKGKEKKPDWNTMVRKNTVSQNPIGSTRSSLQRRSQRSLRRHIVENANASLQQMDTEKLVQFNPKLSQVTPTTRVAYVKFMSKTLTKREEFQTINEKDGNTPGSSDAKPDLSKSIIKTTLTASNKAKTAVAEKAAAAAQLSTTTSAPPQSTGKAAAPSPPDATTAAATKPADAVKKPADTASKTTDIATKPTEGGTKSAAPAPPKTPQDPTKEKAPAVPAAAKTADKPGADAKPAAPGSKPSSETKPADSASKPGEEKKDSKPSETPAEKKDDKQPPGDKKEDKPAENKDAKPVTDAKPAANAKPAAEAKTAAKPEEKKDVKKPTPKPPPTTRPGQSTAAAGGDRGKSTVTGRMISGWL